MSKQDRLILRILPRNQLLPILLTRRTNSFLRNRLLCVIDARLLARAVLENLLWYSSFDLEWGVDRRDIEVFFDP